MYAMKGTCVAIVLAQLITGHPIGKACDYYATFGSVGNQFVIIPTGGMCGSSNKNCMRPFTRGIRGWVPCIMISMVSLQGL